MTVKFVLWLFAVQAHAETRSVDLTVDGHARSYSYVAPSHAEERLPVVLLLPDSGMASEAMLDGDGWGRLAREKNFIAVALKPLPVDPARPEMFQTNPGFWSDGSGRGNAKRGALDDIAYVRAALDDLRRRETVDEKRLFATGLGNGGSMVHRLGMELSDRLAAIAPVAGHLWVTQQPARPLAVILIVGGRDPVDPPAGGSGLNVWTHGLERRPAARLDAASWAEALGCTTQGSMLPLSGGAVHDVWSGCADGGSVEGVFVPGLGHHWPGGADDDMASLGPRDGTLDATRFLWDWFSTHPRS